MTVPAGARSSVAGSLVLSVALLAGCGGGSGGTSPPTTTTATGQLSPMAEVGRQIFSDTALSVSGKQSCATCHVADHAFAAADGRSVPLGGPHMDLPGLRATPSLMYASYAPAFKFASDGTPTGGFFRDGRSPTLADQAQQPFVTSFEMANADAAAVLQKLLTRPYLDQFEAVFGASVVSDPKQALASMGAALAAFQTEDVSFHPFTSKFDAYEAGTTTLTAAELQGLALFNDPTKGNCNACHVSTGSNNVRALFTDFTYDSIGLPRNWKIAANQAASALPYVPANGAQFAPAPYAYYDLGLCGPLRPDLDYRLSLCGAFKVPTLRNVAVKQNYFHNAAYDNLVDAVTWYATRDTNPTRWYRTEDGGIDGAFNDLPASLQGSINRDEVPYNPVTAPTLTSNDIELIVTFLCTLTDGYDPKQPASYRVPSQCQQAAAAARP